MNLHVCAKLLKEAVGKDDMPMKGDFSTEKEALGETLLKYQDIAITLNSFPTERSFSIEDLAEKANVHWNTAKKALIFFSYSAPILPDFILDQDFKFKIIKKSKAVDAINVLFESNELKITTKMMLKGMTSKEKGRSLKELQKYLEMKEMEIIPSILEQGFINSEEGIIYLSTRGKLLGNRGIKKISDLGIPLPWEEKEEEIKVPKCGVSIFDNTDFWILTGNAKKDTWSSYKIIKR